jgi:hypothetical protein
VKTWPWPVWVVVLVAGLILAGVVFPYIGDSVTAGATAVLGGVLIGWAATMAARRL